MSAQRATLRNKFILKLPPSQNLVLTGRTKLVQCAKFRERFVLAASDAFDPKYVDSVNYTLQKREKGFSRLIGDSRCGGRNENHHAPMEKKSHK